MMSRRIRNNRAAGVSAAMLLMLFVSPLLGPRVVWAAETLADRKARIAAMSPAEKEELRRKKERFDQLDEEKQQELRELHKQIVSEPNSRQLMDVMRRYRTWLTTLTATERAELRELSPEKRVEQIRKLRNEQQDKQRAKDFRQTIPEIFKWLAQYVENHEQELLDDLTPEDRGRVQRLRKSSMFRNSSTFRLLLFSTWQRTAGREKPLKVSQEEMKQLEQRLPEGFRKRLEEIAETDVNEKMALVQGWLKDAVPSRSDRHFRRGGWGGRGFRGGPSHDKLQEFFKSELTDEERDKITKKRGDEMHRALMRLYFQKKGGGPWGSGGRRPPGRGSPHDHRPDRRRDNNDRPGPPGDRPPPRRGPAEGRL